MRTQLKPMLTGLIAAIAVSACNFGSGRDTIAEPGQSAEAAKSWIGSWAAAPYGPYPGGPLAGIVPQPLDSLTTPAAFPDEQAVDQSFRMIIHPTLAGDKIRLRLSNLMGEQAVHFAAVHVALRAAGAAIVPDTDTSVSFNGEADLILPPGQEGISDPLDFSFAVGDDLAISFHIREASGPMTWHAVSFDTQFVTPQGAGDTTADPSGATFSEVSVGWFFLSGLDVWREDSPGSIVAIGDSITDGAYQVPASNTRWPDIFAQRLQAAGIPMGVLNQGINSNKVIAGGNMNSGPTAVDRFDRDVLQRAGVRSVVIFEGTNDLSSGADAQEIITGLSMLVDQAHDAGLCVVLGTITPRDDVIFGWDRATMEDTRQTINQWIRDMAAQGRVEGLAEFSDALGTPGDLTRPNPLLFAPDLLHPNSLGFGVMAEQVPIEALVPPPLGNCQR